LYPAQAGDEICYSYGSMRDDYAFMHYGKLLNEELILELVRCCYQDFCADTHVAMPACRLRHLSA
jgi:hypothetical protein